MLMCMLLDMLFVVLLVAESPKAWKENTWVIFHPIIKKNQLYSENYILHKGN